MDSDEDMGKMTNIEKAIGMVYDIYYTYKNTMDRSLYTLHHTEIVYSFENIQYKLSSIVSKEIRVYIYTFIIFIIL